MIYTAPDALLRTQVSDDQLEFLTALLADKDLSVTAAEAACGLSEGTGKRWLRIDRVRKVLGELLRERKERHEDVRSSVILMLWRMACADPRKAWSEQGEQLAPHELPDELAAVLESVKPILSEGVAVAWQYTFAKKTSILDMLLKHFDAPEVERSTSGGNSAKIIFRGVVSAEGEESE